MTPEYRQKLYNALMRGVPAPAPPGLEAGLNVLGEMAMEDIKAIEPIMEEMITEALGARFSSQELVKIDEAEGELIGQHALMVDVFPDGAQLIVRFSVAASRKAHQIHVDRQYAIEFAKFLIDKARS